MNPALSLLTRAGAAGCLAASGVIHAQLYLHGYRTIPAVGPAFLLQAGGALAVALLLLLTNTAVPRLAAAVLALGALAGFAASRTVGILGFVERGLQPAPQALISVITEITTLGLLALPLLCRMRIRSALPAKVVTTDHQAAPVPPEPAP